MNSIIKFCILNFALPAAAGAAMAACILHCIPAWALSQAELAHVTAQHRSETIITEAYLDPARSQPIMLVGAQFDRFINSDFYIGGTITGAISGGVGGYGLGALTIGHYGLLTPGLAVDTRLNIGGAGGGGVHAGGGLLAEALLGLVWIPQPNLEFKVAVGYLQFLSSTYGVPVLSVGLSIPFQHLFIPAS